MRFLKLLLITAICLGVSVCAFAHPGKTDSNGGHTNHSTGEYHYHHGYPAHQHSDMDGDGELDCPFYFEDKTEFSSENSSSSPQNPTMPTVMFEQSNEKPTTSEKPETVPEESKTFFDHVREVTSFLVDIACYLLLGLFGLSVVFWIIDEIKRSFKK